MNDAMKQPAELTSIDGDCPNICLIDIDGDGVPDVVSLNIKWLLGTVTALITGLAGLVL